MEGTEMRRGGGNLNETRGIEVLQCYRSVYKRGTLSLMRKGDGGGGTAVCYCKPLILKTYMCVVVTSLNEK